LKARVPGSEITLAAHVIRDRNRKTNVDGISQRRIRKPDAESPASHQRRNRRGDRLTRPVNLIADRLAGTVDRRKGNRSVSNYDPRRIGNIGASHLNVANRNLRERGQGEKYQSRGRAASNRELHRDFSEERASRF
jgi:hypothetical protein